MWDINEEIQIVGYTLGDNASILDKIEIEKQITDFNEKMRLKNRYKRLQEDKKKIDKELKETKEKLAEKS